MLQQSGVCYNSQSSACCIPLSGVSGFGGFPNLSVSNPPTAAPVESSTASSPHRPREDEFTHPAEPPISNIASALALLSRWRLSKP